MSLLSQRLCEELTALADEHPHNYTAIYSDALEFDVVVDKDGHAQSAERCAAIMNDRDALRILLARRAADVAARDAVIARLCANRGADFDRTIAGLRTE